MTRRSAAPQPIALPPHGLPDFPGTTTAFEVSHGGERLGALTLAKRPGEALTPVERRLAAQLAAQAGLVLHNAGLTEQLKERMAELLASRKRIVEAADGERRRLERNIHDGAQQQLVALSVMARLAETTVDSDKDSARAMVVQAQADAAGALENLRDLARGIYPPLLAERGLVAALEAQARKAPVQVTVEANGLGALPAGSRGRRVLLRTGGAAERGEVRTGLTGDHPPGWIGWARFASRRSGRPGVLGDR